MPKRITEQQASFLRVLLDYKKREGVPPTVREMQVIGGFKSTRSIIQFLDALEIAGYIKRAKGARNIRFVAPPPPDSGSEPVSTVLIPLVGHVSAGTPILADENIEDYLPVSRALARPPFRYYLLRVHGTSMNRAGMLDGDIVLVRQQPTADPGEKVVVLMEEGATVKYFRPGKGAIVLEPSSTEPSNKPFIIHEDFTIQGVVVATLPTNQGESAHA